MNKKSLLAAVILTSLSTGALASESSRVSGEVILATGYMSTNSNLSTKSDARLSDLDGKGEHNGESLVIPLGSITYDLGGERNQRIYLGTSNDDLVAGDLAFEIGYQFGMKNGTQVDLAYLPTVMSGEVWSDPYEVNVDREKTDIDSDAFRIKLKSIAGSDYSLDMAFVTKEVDDEQISQTELHRDSDMYYVKASHLTKFGKHAGLNKAIAYLHNDAEGKAETYDQYEFEMTYFYTNNAHLIALTGSYAYRDYDATNSVFDKTRYDNRHKLFVAYEYADIGGYENWDLVSFAGVNVNDSNIDFYKNEEYIASVGVSYKF